MTDRLDRLGLLCTAMWELLSQRAGVTEADLIEKVAEVDLRDGAADGKARHKSVKTCPSCGRSMSTRHRRCLFCGELDLQSSPLQSLG